jgi:hypothetical protein
MPVSFGLVQAPSNISLADGTNNAVLQGKQGDQIVSELHGKYYTQAYRGNVYWGSTALAGVTLPILSSTSPTFVLWNQSTTKNLSLIRIQITPTTAMTTASGYGYAFLPNAGSAVGTAAPVSAVTPITATRGPVLIPNVAGQGLSGAVVASAATLTSAATIFRNNGMSAGTGAITAPATQPILQEDFDGTLIIPPLCLMIVGTTITTSGQSATGVTAIWEEVPI